MKNNIWALIPARAGSQRAKGKNTRPLGGKPLIKWTIDAARESGIFGKIIISTDDHSIIRDCQDVEIHQRPSELSGDLNYDAEWIKDLFKKWHPLEPRYFSILRPTNPFRTAVDIQKAWNHFQQFPYADSLRSVKESPNPYKMWGKFEEYIYPAFHHTRVNGQELYNLPTQYAPQHWIQCGAIEIGDSRNILFRNNVSGQRIVPFYMDEINGFDINTEFDFQVAEMMVEKGMV